MGLFTKILAGGLQGPLRIIEFGSGIGNFTLPLLEVLHAQVMAIESDPLALRCLEKNLGHRHRDQLTLHPVDLQRGKLLDPSMSDFNSALVDPPRSGLLGFVQQLNQMLTVKNLVYVSCFQESLMRDLKGLMLGGWRIQELHFVDQFPRAANLETVGLLVR